MLLTWVCLSGHPGVVCSPCPGLRLSCLERASIRRSSSPARKASEREARGALPDLIPIQYAAKMYGRLRRFEMLSAFDFRLTSKLTRYQSIINFPKRLWQISSKMLLKKQSYQGLRWRDFFLD